ncbi:MAG: nuclear transport factor 2 family protein [Gammaproteobacteria bacterium]|nr:nuclear transport factor 2 family protein [Gammaproteobacteria bacterium]
MTRLSSAILIAGLLSATVWAQPTLEPRQTQLEAEKALAGKVFNYQYSNGAELRVQFHADSMSWEGVAGPLKDMRGTNGGLRLSRIAENIYFGTWLTDEGGEDSVVYNLDDMTVFAHVLGGQQNTVFQIDGTIGCFGSESECDAPNTLPMSRDERRAIWARNNPSRRDLFGEQDDDLAAEITALLASYERSVNEMDLELAEEVWSQDSFVSFIHPCGHEQGWENVMGRFYLGTMAPLPSRHLRLRDIDVYRLTEDSAWAEFYWDFDATLPDGSPIQTSGRETQIFKRENGAWQIQNVHYSGMPTQAEGEGY